MAKESVPNESPSDRFKRLASKRTQRILEDLRILGNCSNRSGYRYEAEEIRRIFKAIEEEVERVKGLFENGERKQREFKL